MNDPVLKVAVIGDASVEAVEFVRTMPDGTITDERVTCRVEAVYRAIGYRSAPINGIPYDHIRGSVPHLSGRVVDARGRYLDRLYTTGWAKRGPIGLIGHTKSDAKETVDAIIDDVLRGSHRGDRNDGPTAARALLAERGVQVVEWEGWLRLDAHERALGDRFPGGIRERVKVVEREDQVGVARSAAMLGSAVLAGDPA